MLKADNSVYALRVRINRSRPQYHILTKVDSNTARRQSLENQKIILSIVY